MTNRQAFTAWIAVWLLLTVFCCWQQHRRQGQTWITCSHSFRFAPRGIWESGDKSVKSREPVNVFNRWNQHLAGVLKQSTIPITRKKSGSPVNSLASVNHAFSSILSPSRHVITRGSPRRRRCDPYLGLNNFSKSFPALPTEATLSDSVSASEPSVYCTSLMLSPRSTCCG